MNRPHHTLLIVPSLLVLLAGAASAGDDLAAVADQPDPIFKHGFEASDGLDCSARPPQATSRMQLNPIAYRRGGGTYVRTGDMRVYLNIFGAVPPLTGQGAPTFVPFPGNPANQQITWNLPPGSYAAMEFTVPQTLAASTAYEFQFVQTLFLPQNAVASMSLSPCEGDFRADLPNACRSEWDGNDGGLILIVADDSPLPVAQTCRVTRGKTYFYNFVGATLASPGTPSCGATSCSMGVNSHLVIP